MNMKSIFVFVYCLFIALSSEGQAFKLWSNLYGGNASDVGSEIIFFNDSMLIAVGRTSSTGTIPNYGADDFFMCQIRPDGSVIRLKNFGGPQLDQARSIIKLTDSTILVGGFVTGKGNDVSNFYGLTDIWVNEINAHTGKLNWEKSIGGTNNDQLNAYFYLEPGRIVLTGHTKSIDRDLALSPSKGGNDILLCSIDEKGNIIKTTTFGGTDDETAKKILRAEAFGGQMYVFGETESNDLEFSGLSKGKKDIFLLKINRNLNKVYLKTYGGPGDDLFSDAIKIGEESILMFGVVDSVGNQVDSSKGGKDIWMARLDNNGNLLWRKSIGGSFDDIPIKAILNDEGNIYLVSNSNSSDKDIGINSYGGNNDVLLMELDTSGNILWRKYFGGTKGDNAFSMCIDSMGSLYVLANSFSLDHDLDKTNINPPDFWVLKALECKTAYGNIIREACLEDTLQINGNFYFKGNSIGMDSFPSGSFLGCDSVLNISITFKPDDRIFYTDSICFDSSKTIAGLLFDKNHLSDSVFLTNSLGCDSTVIIQVKELSPIEISDTLILKDDGTGKGCIGVQISGACPPFEYRWSNGALGNTVCNLFSGTYTLTVQDCQSCTRTFNFFVPSTVSTAHQDKNLPVILYNPSEVTVHWEGEEMHIVEIISLLGSTADRIYNGTHEIKIVRNALHTGLYALFIKTKSGKFHQLLILI